MIEVIGKGEAYFETGTEGVLWAVHDPTKDGYDGLFVLKNGDLLTIFDKDDSTKILWEDNIELEYKTNQHVYNKEYGHKQQAICGFWIHGLQDNLPEEISKEQWAKWFFDGYPMKLIQYKEFRYSQPNKPKGFDLLKDRQLYIGPHKSSYGDMKDKMAMMTIIWNYLPKTPKDDYPKTTDNFPSSKDTNVFLTKEALINLRDTINEILE